jgi:hypothetical protein
MSREKISRRKKISQGSFASKDFSLREKQCISRRDNNTIREVVIEDSIEIVAEENKVSQASRAQSREGEANKAENPMLVATTTGSGGTKVGASRHLDTSLVR